MAIKLVRKEEVKNTPVNINENLFVQVRNLSEQTDMSVEELVNYFIEQALLQVVFDDDAPVEEPKVEEVKVVESNLKVKGLVNEDGHTVKAKEFASMVKNNIEKMFGKYNSRIYSGVSEYIKRHYNLNDMSEVESLYIEFPEEIESLVIGNLQERKTDRGFDEVLKEKTKELEWSTTYKWASFLAKTKKMSLPDLRSKYADSPSFRIEINNIIDKYVSDRKEREGNGIKVGAAIAIEKAKKVTEPPIKTPAPTVIVLPDTFVEDREMERRYAWARGKYKTKDIGPFLSRSYELLRTKGYVIEQIVKDYQNKYKRRPTKIEAIKADKEAFYTMLPILDNELGFKG